MACDCLTVMDTKLAEHNTRICVTLGFPRDGRPAYVRSHIQTEKVEKRVRKGPAIALPSFCPFCGANYETGQKVDDWQPLETAPRDGTCIDLWGDGYRFADCRWGVPEHECGEAGHLCDSEWHDAEEGWVDTTQNEMVFAEPTHWRPRPAPPEAS